MTEESFVIGAGESGSRLDKAVSLLVPGVSRAQAQQIILSGGAVLNGRTAGKSDKVKEGDEVTVEIPDPVTLDVLPRNIPLDIVYEDADLLVVNKPKGMVVHPAPGNPDGTLVNALLYHCGDSLSGINGVIRPGIVHRIDKDTSGLLIVAKNDAAHTHLARQISEHSFTREYRAVVVGHLRQSEGTVDAPLGRSRTDRKKQAVDGINPRNAVTHYRVLESIGSYDYCAFRLETGRTHQIRVHCAYLGHPVAGDTVYGGVKNSLGLNGQCLHAAKIGFIHPSTGEYLEFSSENPPYFEAFLAKIR